MRFFPNQDKKIPLKAFKINALKLVRFLKLYNFRNLKKNAFNPQMF